MKILFMLGLGLAILAALAVLFFYVVGRGLPANHTASIGFTIAKPRAAVWAALTDYAAQPAWWPAVRSTRSETRADGAVITWTTDRRGRTIGHHTVEARAPERLVREIVGDRLPFGGTWTFELAELDGGTRVTVTEHGFITPPLFRGLAKFFLPPDATMRDFAAHFTPYVTAR